MRSPACVALILPAVLSLSCELDGTERIAPTLLDVAAREDRVLAVGDEGRFFTSSGSTWVASDPLTVGRLRAVLWDGKRWVAVGEKGSLTRQNPDGTWRVWTWANQGAGTLFDVTQCGSRYYAVGTGGFILTSTDTEAWTRVSGAPSSAFLTGVACHGDRAVFTAGGSQGGAYYSVDGGSPVASPSTLPPTCGTVYGGSFFLSVALSGSVYTSADGVTWELSASGLFSASESCDLEHAEGTFALVTLGGEVLSSADGRSWQRLDYGEPKELWGVGLGPGGKLLAVGGGGNLLRANCSGGVCSDPELETVTVRKPASPGGGSGGGGGSSCTCYCENNKVCTRNEDCGVDSNGIQNVCGCPVGCK